ncbi:MAG TPA: hypothetical protein PLR41_00605, partial [Alphaproteobacteria bacterium]|nr:hypothetical protein [Alphaproteobacteria bacterium]
MENAISDDITAISTTNSMLAWCLSGLGAVVVTVFPLVGAVNLHARPMLSNRVPRMGRLQNR